MPDAIRIFIAPPSEETLRTRLIGRGTDDAEQIERAAAGGQGRARRVARVRARRPQRPPRRRRRTSSSGSCATPTRDARSRSYSCIVRSRCSRVGGRGHDGDGLTRRQALTATAAAAGRPRSTRSGRRPARAGRGATPRRGPGRGVAAPLDADGRRTCSIASSRANLTERGHVTRLRRNDVQRRRRPRRGAERPAPGGRRDRPSAAQSCSPGLIDAHVHAAHRRGGAAGAAARGDDRPLGLDRDSSRTSAWRRWGRSAGWACRASRRRAVRHALPGRQHPRRPGARAAGAARRTACAGPRTWRS